mgnify:CR=1 FL=1
MGSESIAQEAEGQVSYNLDSVAMRARGIIITILF